MSEDTPRTLENWEDLAKRELKGGDPDDLVWQTPEGIAVKPLYTAADLEGLETLGSLPGFPPYLRGPRATMYANRPWTLRQYAGFSTAEESNAFYKQGLKSGQKGLSVAFDLATHRGYDSDHPRVVGDVGKAGVAIDSVEDMNILFDGIPLDEMSVSMTMNGAVLPVLALLHHRRRRTGRAARRNSAGTIQNDILKEFMVRNTYIYPPAPSMRIVADIIAYTRQRRTCRSSTPSRSPATTCRRPAATAGAGTGLHHGRRHGICPRRRSARVSMWMPLRPRLSFFFCHRHELLHGGRQAAQPRASVGQAHHEEFGAKNPQDAALRTHCQTSGVSAHRAGRRTTTWCAPAFEAMAAALGGTQSLHTNGLRRSHRAAHRLLGADRAQHPAHPAARDRHHQRDRPAGVVLLRRKPDLRPGG